MDRLVRIRHGVVLAALVLAACGGAATPDTTAAPGSVTGDAAAGQVAFDATCVSCHGPGGIGLPNLGKPLVNSPFVQSLTDQEMVDFISVGRPASDPENTTGVDMPPKGGNPALSDQDLADIVQHLRTLQQ